MKTGRTSCSDSFPHGASAIRNTIRAWCLVEAVVRGRQIPLKGVALVSDGVEGTSILATLQNTNAFVASSLV